MPSQARSQTEQRLSGRALGGRGAGDWRLLSSYRWNTYGCVRVCLVCACSRLNSSHSGRRRAGSLESFSTSRHAVLSASGGQSWSDRLRSAAVIWNEVDRRQGWLVRGQDFQSLGEDCSVHVATMDPPRDGSWQLPPRLPPPAGKRRRGHPRPWRHVMSPCPLLKGSTCQLCLPRTTPVAGMPGGGEQRPGWPFGMPSQKFRPSVSAVAPVARCRPRLPPSGLVVASMW